MLRLPPRLRPRVSTIALAVVFFAVLVGLGVADRTLRESEGDSADADAQQAAALVEGFLAARAEALSAFRVLLADATAPVDSAQFRAVVAELGDHLTGFRRVWFADSSGVVVHQVILGGPTALMPSALDIDTLQLLGARDAVQRARARKRIVATRPDTIFSAEHGFALLEPIHIRGTLVGFVGGTIAADVLRRAVSRASRSNTRVVVTSGGDTVVTIGALDEQSRLVTPSHATARVPDEGQWGVDVWHSATRPSIRVGLWTVAIGALISLALAVMYERRQSRRIAERSRELEHLSTELLRANRAKSEFLANVSHELRTPLNAIVGFVDLLREGVYGELKPRQVGPVERIEASANHLRHLVDQILDLAKMAAGRLEVHTEILDLRPFVLNVASEVESLVNEKGLSLSIGVGASLPRVRTDPTHLRQILVNLLGNAVKFTAAGTIAVRTRLVGAEAVARGRRWRPEATPDPLRERAPKPDLPWIALQVADTGVGISEADRDRIFDEFEQVNAGPRGDSMRRGTGLGLSISRRLARLLGGDLTVVSEVGRGSVFTVWIPVDPADMAEDAKGRREAPPPASTVTS